MGAQRAPFALRVEAMFAASNCVFFLPGSSPFRLLSCAAIHFMGALWRYPCSWNRFATLPCAVRTREAAMGIPTLLATRDLMWDQAIRSPFAAKRKRKEEESPMQCAHSISDSRYALKLRPAQPPTTDCSHACSVRVPNICVGRIDSVDAPSAPNVCGSQVRTYSGGNAKTRLRCRCRIGFR